MITFLTTDDWRLRNLLTPFKRRINGGRCYLCGKVQRRLTEEHVVPRSRGGEHSFHNILFACERCNRMEADRPARPCELLYLRSVLEICRFVEAVSLAKRTDPKRVLWQGNAAKTHEFANPATFRCGACGSQTSPYDLRRFRKVLTCASCIYARNCAAQRKQEEKVLP